MKKFIFFLMFFLIYDLFACTTAIISGKFTTNGRPLLLKHRDSDHLQNKLMFFNDGEYEYIGLVNSDDINGDEVWGGVNSEGFAIINSASYNMKDRNDTTTLKDKEGVVMKRALQECSTVDDFENLLKEYDKPIGVEANFGVIDAHGGAAYFETNNFSYKKFDVNEPSNAPFGYAIRTNYSFNGTADDGYGYIRYLTAEELFYKASEENNLNKKFILQDISRSLKHSLLDVDYNKNVTISSNDNSFIAFQDYIVRNNSTSTVLIEGVKPDEDPELSTLWTILGFQFTSVAIPTWVKAGNTLPDILIADSTGNAPLCNYALKLKNQCFPIKRGSGYRYLKLSKVINKEGKGFVQVLRPIENEIIYETDKKLKQWRSINNLPIEEVHNLYRWINKMVKKTYKDNFGLQ
ncbi:MAG: hypothetical protein GXO85_02065 [Chlorobi bacterium]|nr:hypothetical protein [Chlorobiota bacterium]